MINEKRKSIEAEHNYIDFNKTSHKIVYNINQHVSLLQQSKIRFELVYYVTAFVIKKNKT